MSFVDMLILLMFLFRCRYVCSHNIGTFITAKIALYKILQMICFNKRHTGYNDYQFRRGAGGTYLYINLGELF